MGLELHFNNINREAVLILRGLWIPLICFHTECRQPPEMDGVLTFFFRTKVFLLFCFVSGPLFLAMVSSLLTAWVLHLFVFISDVWQFLPLLFLSTFPDALMSLFFVFFLSFPARSPVFYILCFIFFLFYMMASLPVLIFISSWF